GRQEQADTRHDEQAGDEEKLLRPDFDEEEIKAPAGQIYQHRLVGRPGAAAPAEPRGDIVHAERRRHDPPFEAAEGAAHAARMDLDPRLVERSVLALVYRRDV